MAKESQHKLKKVWLRHAYKSSIWDTGNQYLYDLCSAYPDHTDESQILAKVWLIGRAYSASAERGVSGKGKADEYLINLAKKIKSKKIDNKLLQLPNNVNYLNDNLKLIVQTHAYVQGVFASGIPKQRVSLTSKYLHFHKPNLFPIYDSRVITAIPKVTPDARHCSYTLPDNLAKTEYGKFCIRYAWLVDEIAKLEKIIPTIRQVDNMLLKIYKDTNKK